VSDPGRTPPGPERRLVRREPAPEVEPPLEAPPPPPTTALGELTLLGVLLGVCVGLVLVGQDHWKKGLYVVALSVLGAAGLRLVLPARNVGLLAVRSRLVDVLVLGGVGAAIFVLTLAVPVPHR
jgi:hypothetical protein